ncbi:hypothetical protein C8F01DRAFT_1264799 [Mycena amicta]|nr:hypothetical protein C8F01DRAFT_1264799 [Mycena amicta]
MCRSFFQSAVSQECAFTFFEACTHSDDRTDDTSDSASDDSDHYGLQSDQQQDDVENLAIHRVVEQTGYNPICGNLVVVKHSIVDNLPARIKDAELYNVLAEDFPLIHGFIRRYILGDWECSDLPIRLPASAYGE